MRRWHPSLLKQKSIVSIDDIEWDSLDKAGESALPYQSSLGATFMLEMDTKVKGLQVTMASDLRMVEFL